MVENPFNPGYYTEGDLESVGFRSLGENVRIAKNTTIVGVQNITIGSNVRIDGYSTIIAGDSGWLRVGSYVHIGGYCYLSAGDGIGLDDFSGLSQGVRIYSRTDDYSGEYLTNPTVPEQYTGVRRGAVELGRHVIVGSGTVILPALTLGEGSAVGALSLVTKSLDPWCVFSGRPARRLKTRSKRILELEKKLKNEFAKDDHL
ncbi:MAG: acyltransferase [Halieaceae bacterium]|jgi:galactoside O-acetyltransferase|nr:acyltransferase [Halieaceae bacterium]